MRPRLPTILLALSSVALAGCRAAVPRGTSELRVIAGRGASLPSTAFHATIRPAVADTSPDPGVRARVTLLLTQDGMEYHMRLENPGSRLVTGAWLVVRSGDDASAVPLVHLFSDGRYRDRFIEVRGTVAVPAALRSGVLAEEIQGNPAGFAVVLQGQGARERWSGPLRVGR